jgi:hypothetical protein
MEGREQPMRVVSSLTGESFRSHEVCVMCGVLLGMEDGRRSKTARTFQCMLENRWRETPYVWASVREVAGSGKDPNHRLTACTACINWIRRSVPSNEHAEQSVGKRKVYLLIDRLICFSLAPGEVACPDMRNMRRLLSCLLEEKVIGSERVVNYYRAAVLPEHLRLALEECGGEVNVFIRRVVLRWFREVNNSSPVFRHPNTAYIVRKALGWTKWDTCVRVCIKRSNGEGGGEEEDEDETGCYELCSPGDRA